MIVHQSEIIKQQFHPPALIAVIINPIAGGRVRDVGARVELARRVAGDCGETADVYVTEQPGHARALARAARDRGARLILAWGGDGTANEVASELVFTETPMAVVAGGSGNGLAHALGVDANPGKAVSAALQAVPRAIDVGEIGERLFVNVAGIGFDAHVAMRFNSRSNRRRGWRSYTWLTAVALARYRTARYEIVTPESRGMVQALLVVLANGAEFGNRIRIAPAARVDDAALDLIVVTERSRLGTIGRLPLLLAGGLERSSAWSSQRVAEVVVRSAHPMLFHVDGEPVQGGTTLSGRVLPAALKVCV